MAVYHAQTVLGEEELPGRRGYTSMVFDSLVHNARKIKWNSGVVDVEDF